jgi:hypothetical protein
MWIIRLNANNPQRSIVHQSMNFPLTEYDICKTLQTLQDTLQDIYIIMKKPNLNEQKHNEHHLYKNKTKNITFQWRYTLIDESLLPLSIGGKSL